MNVNETTLPKRQNDTDINNYRSPYDNNEQSTYRIVSYKSPEMTNVKQF